MQAELDTRSEDVIRKESQVMIALQERESSVQRLKDQEGNIQHLLFSMNMCKTV